MRPFRTLVFALPLALAMSAVPARAQSAADFEQILKQMAQQAAALQVKADSMLKAGLPTTTAPSTEGAPTTVTPAQAQQLADALKAMEQAVAGAGAAAGVDLTHLTLPGVSIPKPAASAPSSPAGRGGCGGASLANPQKAAEVKAQMEKLRSTPGADPGTLRTLQRLYNAYQGRSAPVRNCRFG